MEDPRLRQHIGAGDSLIRELLQHAEELRHDGSDAQIHAVALYGSTLELFSGCIVLAKVGEPTGIAVLLRPMYEALVDLDNLLSDATYVEHMEAANLRQVIGLISAAQGNNLLLQGFIDKTPEISTAMQSRFSELEAAGKRSLAIEERCRRAGRLDEYKSFYRLICLDSHNNSAALADRHIKDQSSGIPLISFFQEPDPVVVSRRLELGMGIVVQAARMVHGAFRVSSDHLEALVLRYQGERLQRLQSLG